MKLLVAQAPDTQFVELFAGSAAVSLRLGLTNVLLNDVNPILIGFHYALASGTLINAPPLVVDATAFGLLRQEFNERIAQGDYCSPRQAQLLYALNKSAFNGLYRVNSSGLFNVPWNKRQHQLEFGLLSRYWPLMSRWGYLNQDFSQVALPHGALVFADPPYVETFDGYSPGGFNACRQTELADILAQHDGPVIATNSAVPDVVNLYQKRGFDVVVAKTPRCIAAKASSRTPAMEMIAVKGLDTGALRKAS